MTSGLAKRTRGDLSHYDPERGLKRVAVSEAAEKHYARAKDATMLEQAIRAKLEAQAEFVLWWDTQAEKATRGQPKKNSDRSVRILRLGQNGLPDPKIVSRWRNKLNDPSAFEATYRSALARYVKIIEFRQSTGSPAGVNMPESNEWYTPARYIEAARSVLGDIDLDPSSSEIANTTVKAAQIFTQDDDGLSQPWHGRVWMNPPYSGQAAAFIERLVQALACGDVTAAVVLVNSHGTDTQWFQPLWAGTLCFTNHRINFVAPGGGEESGSNHGSVFAYFGTHQDRFVELFTPFGAVVERVRR